jgi:hypothetical protein
MVSVNSINEECMNDSYNNQLSSRNKTNDILHRKICTLRREGRLSLLGPYSF